MICNVLYCSVALILHPHPYLAKWIAKTPSAKKQRERLFPKPMSGKTQRG